MLFPLLNAIVIAFPTFLTLIRQLKLEFPETFKMEKQSFLVPCTVHITCNFQTMPATKIITAAVVWLPPF